WHGFKNVSDSIMPSLVEREAFWLHVVVTGISSKPVRSSTTPSRDASITTGVSQIDRGERSLDLMVRGTRNRNGAGRRDSVVSNASPHTSVVDVSPTDVRCGDVTLQKNVDLFLSKSNARSDQNSNAEQTTHVGVKSVDLVVHVWR